MRRPLTALAATALSLSVLAFAPTTGETDPTTEPGTEPEAPAEMPAPIDVTMHLHGDAATALIDEDSYAGDAAGVLEMDRIAPTGDFSSKQITNYAQGPNARCAGNGLLPVWSGFLGHGTLVGEGTLSIDVVGSTGGTVVVDVFTDVTGQACNEAYVEPVASATVVLPVGTGRLEVPLDLDGVDPDFYIMVQLRGADSPNGVDNPQPNPGAPTWPGRIAPTDPTAQARVLYGGTEYDATFTFTCQPDELLEGETVEDADCLPF